MIRNGRQAAIAKKKHQDLILAARNAKPGQGSSFLVLAEGIASELAEYEAIRDGLITTFAVHGLDDIGDALTKARIAKGFTHRQLADELGVSEQMIQKDEARSYENAGLARIAEVSDALGYELVGTLQPATSPAVYSWGGALGSSAWGAVASSSVYTSTSLVTTGATLINASLSPGSVTLNAFNPCPWGITKSMPMVDSSFPIFGVAAPIPFNQPFRVGIGDNNEPPIISSLREPRGVR
jgi:hypothetical protein